MQRALDLARLGRGYTRQNPLVGAVIVHQGQIIGEGWHQKFGGPHAEINAIRSVKDPALLKEATIYVTLEPCAHVGKTPSCAQTIAEIGIPNVVIGCKDPYEKVCGKGIKILVNAGAQVIEGVLEDQAKELIYPFRTHILNKRPFIHLKWAQSADGFMGLVGEQTAITAPLTSFVNHKIRAESDAILVGSQTLKTDNPSLDNRLYPGASPMKILIDRKTSLDITNLNVSTSKGHLIVFTTDSNARNDEKVNFHLLKGSNSGEQLSFILETLYDEGLASLMVEGGAKMLNSFLAAGLWDQITIFKSPNALHQGIPAPVVKAKLHKRYQYPPDEIIVLRPNQGA